MIAEKDPRIEAVAKLLFTGPMWGFNDADWESWTCSGFRERAMLAAEDVLRGIDEADGWEYGVSYSQWAINKYVNGWTGWMFSDQDKAVKCASEHLDGSVLRRRAAGQPEPLPVNDKTCE